MLLPRKLSFAALILKSIGDDWFSIIGIAKFFESTFKKSGFKGSSAILSIELYKKIKSLLIGSENLISIFSNSVLLEIITEYSCWKLLSIFGVFDGHGGNYISKRLCEFCKTELFPIFGYQKNINNENITQGFLNIDTKFYRPSLASPDMGLNFVED